MEAPDTFEDLEALWLAWRTVQPESRNKYATIYEFLNLIDMPALEVGVGWEKSARREVWAWAVGVWDNRGKAKEKYEAWREEVKRERTTDLR